MACRYFMRLAYNGAPFHGWQTQPNAVSVQETLEKAMSMVMRMPMAITGAGRTDTGVNARTMVAHFDVEEPISDTARLVRQLNSIVGRDIAVYQIVRVGDEAHARFDATSRTYKYFIGLEKSPFSYPFCWTPPYKLDVEAMNRAAKRLFDYTDFTSFSKLHTDVKTNNCRIDHACWQMEGDKLVFTVTADRFLRNMVRAIVGLRNSSSAKSSRKRIGAAPEHQFPETRFSCGTLPIPILRSEAYRKRYIWKNPLSGFRQRIFCDLY